MLTRVLPTDGPTVASTADALSLYEIVAADPLPTIDLSVSIKSCLIPKSWQPTFARFLRHGRAIFASYIAGCVAGIAALPCDAQTGRILAVFSLVLQLPGALVSLSMLRWYLVVELLRTFDFWFFFSMTASTFVLFSAQFTDARICLNAATWIAMIPNMLIDAHLRGVKRMAMGNVVAIIALVELACIMKYSKIDETTNFAVVHRGKRTLRSDDFILNGVVTMIALLTRNVARLHSALSTRHGRHEIQCVSYRSVLRLVRKTHAQSHQSSAKKLVTESTKAKGPTLHHIQQLTLKTESGAIEGHRMLWPRVAMRITHNVGHNRRAYQLFGWCSFGLSTIASTLVSIGLITDWALDITSWATVLSASLVFTGSAALFQRQLLRRLISSFDFLYLSCQITAIHLTACDFSEWHASRCLVVVSSWLWIHWALCTDAVSPLLKDTVRVHLRFPAVVLTISVLNGLVLMYAVVFLDASDEPYDRVLPLFEAKVSVGVLPIFCNSLATVLLISLRLLYRAWTFSGDKLLVLEGQVVYQNHLANAKLTGHRSNGQPSSQMSSRGGD